MARRKEKRRGRTKAEEIDSIGEDGILRRLGRREQRSVRRACRGRAGDRCEVRSSKRQRTGT